MIIWLQLYFKWWGPHSLRKTWSPQFLKKWSLMIMESVLFLIDNKICVLVAFNPLNEACRDEHQYTVKRALYTKYACRLQMLSGIQIFWRATVRNSFEDTSRLNKLAFSHIFIAINVVRKTVPFDHRKLFLFRLCDLSSYGTICTSTESYMRVGTLLKQFLATFSNGKISLIIWFYLLPKRASFLA